MFRWGFAKLAGATAAVVCALVIVPGLAHACSCVQREPGELLREGAPALIAEVLDKQPVSPYGDPPEPAAGPVLHVHAARGAGVQRRLRTPAHDSSERQRRRVWLLLEDRSAGGRLRLSQRRRVEDQPLRPDRSRSARGGRQRARSEARRAGRAQATGRPRRRRARTCPGPRGRCRSAREPRSRSPRGQARSEDPAALGPGGQSGQGRAGTGERQAARQAAVRPGSRAGPHGMACQAAPLAAAPDRSSAGLDRLRRPASRARGRGDRLSSVR